MRSMIQAALLSIPFLVSAQEDPYLIVGTYTSGKSKGMYVYRFHTKTGSARLVDSVASSNPSYLATSADGKAVYAVNEDAPEGGITAFSFNRTNGHLTPLNRVKSRGAHPCYVALDQTGRWVVAGNYSSGSLVVYKRKKRNDLGDCTEHVVHEGSSINKDRQKSPHVHATVFSPDNKFLFVPDLGTDKVMIYAFDAKKGKLKKREPSFVKLEGGSGPRHFTFHPNGNWAYLVQELSGSVTAFNYKKGRLESFQMINSLPPDYKGPASGADIHISPDGKFLYASNRGASNTIACFRIDPVSGRLSAVGHYPTLGKTPRNFNFDPSGNFLLVANQNSDAIVVFAVNRQTGALTDTGNRIDAGNPVCIQWIR